jgi:hypothetical protein
LLLPASSHQLTQTNKPNQPSRLVPSLLVNRTLLLCCIAAMRLLLLLLLHALTCFRIHRWCWRPRQCRPLWCGLAPSMPVLCGLLLACLCVPVGGGSLRVCCAALRALVLLACVTLTAGTFSSPSTTFSRGANNRPTSNSSGGTTGNRRQPWACSSVLLALGAAGLRHGSRTTT